MLGNLGPLRAGLGVPDSYSSEHSWAPQAVMHSWDPCRLVDSALRLALAPGLTRHCKGRHAECWGLLCRRAAQGRPALSGSGRVSVSGDGTEVFPVNI